MVITLCVIQWQPLALHIVFNLDPHVITKLNMNTTLTLIHHGQSRVGSHRLSCCDSFLEKYPVQEQHVTVCHIRTMCDWLSWSFSCFKTVHVGKTHVIDWPVVTYYIRWALCITFVLFKPFHLWFVVFAITVSWESCILTCSTVYGVINVYVFLQKLPYNLVYTKHLKERTMIASLFSYIRYSYCLIFKDVSL